MINILGIAGSLRKDSFNKAALKVAQEVTPTEAKLEIYDLSDIPLYNQDNEVDMPPTVKNFKLAVESSDAILFVTPEYNYSIPGVLKNAMDWASRPMVDNSWKGKPAAIMSVSTGKLGGVRAQYHLRQVLTCLNVFAMNQPEVMISGAYHKFDKNGDITDEETKIRIRQLVEALISWTLKLQ